MITTKPNIYWKYITFLISGLPAWILGLYIVHILKDAYPFWIILIVFHTVTIHANFIMAKIFVFAPKELGSRYTFFLKHVILFRVAEYFFSLLIYKFILLELFSIIVANGIISVIKFKTLTRSTREPMRRR
jgi:hypothetical protein